MPFNDQKIQFAFIQKSLLTLTILMGVIYYLWWFDFRHAGNMWLYGLLLFGETYHIIMALTFWYTIWPHKTSNAQIITNKKYDPPVAIFVPVVSEPLSVVRSTIISAKNISYPNKNIYILNDGYVAKNPRWEDYELLAEDLHVYCITRRRPGGAKAGNINNALRLVKEKFIAIFDADMQAEPNFLSEIMPYFADKDVGFVQTPQFYSNHALNEVTKGAWEQQNFFFGSIMIGKNNYNAAFICGTNMVIRKQALWEVGGMREDNIAEDFITSMAIHQRGWKSVYLPDVLATGLAPFDLGAYFSQQLRWTRGSLSVLFSECPLFKRHLTWAQRIQYFSSALYYFNGLIVAIDMLIPLVFLLFGIQPVSASTTTFALFFVPYMFLSLYTIYIVSAQSMTFRAFSFSQSSFWIQLLALWSMITRQKMSFAVTSKEKGNGTYFLLCLPHVLYVVISFFIIEASLQRYGPSAAVLANVAWVLFNISLFIPFIYSAIVPSEKKETKHAFRPLKSY